MIKYMIVILSAIFIQANYSNETPLLGNGMSGVEVKSIAFSNRSDDKTILDERMMTVIRCKIDNWILNENENVPYYGRFVERDYKIDITDLFYSEDSNRYIAYCIIGYKLKDTVIDYSKYNDSFIYDSRAVIGYNELNSCKIMPLNLFIGLEYSTLSEARNSLVLFFEKEIADRYLYVEKSNYKKIGYTITESEFWTHSALWIKGKLYGDSYPFELNDNGTKVSLPLDTCCYNLNVR